MKESYSRLIVVRRESFGGGEILICGHVDEAE